MNIYSLILAGGSGTRFWPLSRTRKPKQLLNLIGNDIMINETINRCSSLVRYENTFIAVNQAQYDSVYELLVSSVPKKNILSEPVAKNTAPCILYAAMTILKQHGDGVLCIFPSDHYITKPNAYLTILKEGIAVAKSRNTIVTLGVKPSYPATGYGYIKVDREKISDNGFKIDRFVEKPNLEKAIGYVSSGNYFWNAGVFICKISVLISLFERFLPRIYQKLVSIGDDPAALDEIYPQLDRISIDFGIMERIENAFVVTGDFGWNDVGSWDALSAISPIDESGNVIKAEHIVIDTKNCILYSDSAKMIAAVGINEIVVVDTDDALLICRKDKAQDVKRVVDRLKEQDMLSLL